MLPKYHIFSGFTVSYILVYFFNFSLFAGIIVFLSSFLIDIDHYFFSVYKRRDLSLLNSIKEHYKLRRKLMSMPWKKRRKYKTPIMIFHGIEFWILIIILSFFSNIFLLILIGIIIHMSLDFIDIIYHHAPIYTKLSVIAVLQKNKSKEDIKGL